MMYVLAPNYAVFRSFCHEFRLRETVSDRSGGVVYLDHPDKLAGLGHHNIILVAYDGAGLEKEWLELVRARCGANDIPLLFVPDLARARFMKDHLL